MLKYNINLPLILLAFFLLALALWPYYIDIRILPHLGINPQRILLLGMIVNVFILFTFTKKFRYRVSETIKNHKILFIIIAVYLLFRSLSCIGSAQPFYSILIVVNELLSHFFIMVFILLFIKTDKEKKILITIIIISAALVSAYTLFEYMYQYNFFREFASEYTRAGQVASEIKLRNGLYRVQGPFDHPITLAQYILFCVGILLISNYASFMKIILLFLFSSTIVLTGSRIGEMALLILLVLTLMAFLLIKMNTTKKDTQYFFVSMIFLLLAGGVSVLIYKLLNSFFIGSYAEISSSLTRVTQIVNGVDVILSSPILGTGPGFAAESIYEVGSLNSEWYMAKPSIDNYFLSIGVESGIISLILYTFIYIYVYIGLKKVISILKYQRKPFFKIHIFSFTLTALVISMFVLSIFHNVTFTFILLGIILTEKETLIKNGIGIQK